LSRVTFCHSPHLSSFIFNLFSFFFCLLSFVFCLDYSVTCHALRVTSKYSSAPSITSLKGMQEENNKKINLDQSLAGKNLPCDFKISGMFGLKLQNHSFFFVIKLAILRLHFGPLNSLKQLLFPAQHSIIGRPIFDFNRKKSHSLPLNKPFPLLVISALLKNVSMTISSNKVTK